MVWSDPCTEVSQTANTCTDPEINSGQAQTGTAYEAVAIGMSKHIITKSGMIVAGYIDAAAIGRRLFILPGEVSLFIQTKGEVSRGHSSCRYERVPFMEQHGRSHKTAKD